MDTLAGEPVEPETGTSTVGLADTWRLSTTTSLKETSAPGLLGKHSEKDTKSRKDNNIVGRPNIMLGMAKIKRSRDEQG